ncbi:MAG: hypothetical protein ABIP27_16745 [Flavobacterium circumlabens]|uniref:hypothetical protein n=1 Tax=Flavobacterium circumlabens TaxID=2133765 RepID=UPI00326558C8
MKLPKHIQLKIDSFKPEYKELKFTDSNSFLLWLRETSETEIIFKDSGQDLIKFFVSESGEILHTEVPSLSNIYNGALLLDNQELIISGDNIAIWIPEFNEVSTIKYEVKKVIRKSHERN